MTKKKSRVVALESFDDLDAAGIGAGYRSPFVRDEQPLPDEAPRDRSLLRTAADYGITALKGAISVPEAAVGLADIPTGGRVGRVLESAGFRPKDAKAMLDEQYSGQQKQAFQNVQQAEGFGGKFVAALQNPSVISHSVVESLPSMGAGGVVGRGMLAAAPRVGGVLAAGAGEGVVGAGSAAEQIRQETPDGLMTAGQSGFALASGAGTMAFGVLGNKIAKSLGIHDVDTMLVGAATNPAAAKGVVRRVLEGAASEGILEELPQSIQEQVLQNAALGKDLAEGVDQAAVLGMLSGAAMGGGANLLSGGHQAQPAAVAAPVAPVTADPLALPAPVITVGQDGIAQTAGDRQTVREAGPLARAANANTAVDVEQKDGALSRAATAAFTPGAIDEVTPTQVDPLPVGGEVGATGGAELLDASPSVADPTAGPGRVADDMPPGAPSAVSPGDVHVANAGDTAVAPVIEHQVFPTYEEADTYRREQKQRGANVQALPVPTDGGFTLAVKGSANYPAAEQFRADRIAAQERADAGILDGDILNRLGKPFTIRLPAANAVKKAGDGFEVVEVKGGFVARRKAAPSTPAPAIAGEAIDKDWTAFAPESGTLEIPRAEMPQVKAEHRGALVNFLGARGVTHETAEVPADTLKPTQAEFSPEKVAAAMESDGDRAVLVSADGHVVDGHHQWMAKRNEGETVKVIRWDAPVAELLPLVKEFPSASVADGATAANTNTPQPEAAAKAETGKPENPGAGDAETGSDAGIVEHTTGRGKVLRGTIRTDLTKEEATALDPYTFKKDGGFFIRVSPSKAPPAAVAEPAAPVPAAAKESPAVSANKVFTEDAAAAARALLKKKLGQLNSGIDPELLQAGITLAGYHIEKGARTFAAYAKAMLDDMGDGVRPYLKSFYMAVKFDPRAMAFEGMDTAAAVEAVNLDSIEAAAPGPDTGGKEDGHATRDLDRTGTRALAGAPAQDVRPADQERQAGASVDRSGGSDGGSDTRADDAGRDVGRGLGSDTPAVPVPARGTTDAGADAKKPGISRAPRVDAGPERLRPQREGLTPAPTATTAPNAAPVAAPQITAEDFTIDADLALGEGGQVTKYQRNLDAIKLLSSLQQEGRMATPAEQKILAGYVGWGGLPQAFDLEHKDWSKRAAELKALLTEQDYDDARRSTRYAHYTSRQIIEDGIYAALRRFGFTGGKTLEAGAGVGNFLGLMPADMRSAGRFTAIEREPFSAAIAQQLYPRQNVQRADFTEFSGSDGYFDVAVGNPPFAADPQTDRSGRKHLSGLSLHNYFFAKSVDMLREGGILAQVITNAFLDSKADVARRYIGDRTKFLGAIRLPNNAFAQNAGTEVTTDIVFLQKLPDAEVGGRAARADAKRWLDTGTFTDAKGKQVALNRYFLDNPEMMLGEFGAFGTMYNPNFPALVARPGQDTTALLRDAVAKLPASVYRNVAEQGTTHQTQAAIVALKNPPVREGGFFMDGEKLMQRAPDLAGEARGTEITAATQWTEKTTLGEAGFARVKALTGLRGTVRGLIAAEMADNEKDMTALRAQLNTQYDAYRATHGLINDPSTLRVFDDDPDFPLLASLEHDYKAGIGPAAAKRMGIKPVVSSAKKGPIFSRRVVAARAPVRAVKAPADALAVSMAERGRLDAAYIGQLLGKEPEAVLRELSSGDEPLLFRDPASDEYVLRDAYLSGNVRAKLAQAKAAGMFGNIKALEAVQPADVGSHEISARIGSPWVPEAVYEDFAKTLFGPETRARVTYMRLNSSYQVSVSAGNSVALTNTWGTSHVSGDDLLAGLLNNRSIKVQYKDSEGKVHTNIEATEAANSKAQEIRDKFKDWLFTDADRSELLVRAYNDTNNNYVTRVYDGSMMTFPGKVPDEIIKFRRHQRNAIARGVQDRTALLDHVVGAGKTYTVVATAMELKRTGLANKPMVAVPNHLVKQWAADWYRLYPGANILTATKKDFEKANRRKFLAKIATGDWDAVIIAHSSYGFIRPAPEFEAEFNRKQVADIVRTISEVKNGDADGPQKKRTVKQLEGLKERLENRIKSLRDKPMDDLLDFQQIGVDQLFVDEFHMFKNLMFSTKMQNVQGLGDSAGSQRAYDMFVKINQIYEQNGRGQGVIAATGTPVSNSLAEMYHMMRYLMPEQMRSMGFESFDAWANTFASVEQVWMQKPSGDGFKASNRMSNFVNTTELLKLFDQVSDTVTMDDIKTAYREENAGKEFPLPKLKTGRRQPVSLDKSDAQNDYMDEIAKRAAIVEARKGPPQKGDDNVLVIMGDARKAAMDIRLVNPDIVEREKGGRIDMSAANILARYRQFDKWKGTQLVFSDLGTPIKHAKAELKEYEALQARIAAGDEDTAARAALGDENASAVMADAEDAQGELDAKGSDWLGAVQAALRGFSIYDDMRAALVERGIPESEIAFIHDYNTDDQKAGLFKKVNAGQVRVLLGSTAKMGAGTNVQERLVALHHLDVPWRPSDVEQREGRIERQGNALMSEIPGFEVEILAYVTKDTLDMRMWQVQEVKLKMINQLRTRKVSREIDNAFEHMEMSAGEMQAAATGNMDLLREIQLRTDVKKLEQRRRAFDGQRNDLIGRKRRVAEALRTLPQQIADADRKAVPLREYFASLEDTAKNFKITIDGKEYTSVSAAQEYLREKVDAKVEGVDAEGKKTSRAAPVSIEINGETFTNRAGVADAFSEARGDADMIRWSVNGEEFNRRSKIANAIRQGVVDSIADEIAKPIGTIAGFDVVVEGQTDKTGNSVDVTLSRDGQVEMSNSANITDSNRAPDSVIRVVDNLLQSAIQEASYMRRRLTDAQKNQAELDTAEVQGEWPDQGKLEAARAAHKEVLTRLNTATPTPAAEAPKFSRAESTTGLPVADVQAEVDELASKWANAPKVVVVPNIDDPRVPAAVRQERDKRQSLGTAGAPRGVYLNGTVYLLADQLPTRAHAAITLFHETLGHAGLRGAFGDALNPILQQIADLRRGDIAEKAEEYNLDLKNPQDRLIAAEEVLAEWAQSRPELGYVKRAIAVLRNWLRKIPGFRNMAMTDDEIVANFLIPARGWVERGGPNSPGPRGGTKPAFSKEASALSELSMADGLFALPKSAGTTLSAIVADNEPAIKVRETKFPGNETMYTLTMPDKSTARITVRKSGADSVYGAELRNDNSYDWQQGRPGENPEDVPPGTEDVWIDVSTLTPGQNGAMVYNIAATFAYNTGRIFIGDPSGLSDDAMRRRSEQMLSSALKFGTTAHLAPHPRQVEGDARIGVPPLKWVYGDHEGNIERLIDLNVKALENALPESNLIAYDHDKQSFYRTDTGETLQRGQLAFVVGRAVRKRLGVAGGATGTGQAGWRTLARAALFKYLQTAAQAGGRTERGSLLDGLRNERAGLERRGDQSPDSGSEGAIFYSRGGNDTGLNDARDFRAQATRGIRDLFQAPGTVSWWHKTIGSMHNLAKRSPQFGKVFDAVQDFLGDVSAFATEAANLAPTLLPKLETWRDIGKSPISAEDSRAVAAPIFEGTLTWARDANGKAVKLGDLEATYANLSDEQKGQMLLRKGVVTAEQLQRWQASKIDVYSGAIRNRFESTFLKGGIVFNDAELVSLFKLTPEQIKLYREFRAATDQSLNTMTISEMLRFGGADVEGMRDMAMAAGTARDAGNLLRDYLLDAAEEQPERKSLLIDTANTMIEKADKAQDLIDRGYAPLSRFGHYTVDVLDEQGDRAYFGMFESRAEANGMARKMRENYPKGAITQGTVSEQAYKLFAGITPETMELFGEMVGLEAEGDDAKHQMFQEYLKLAKSNRSAMKRLIARKGIAGFSEDAGRVLAGFIYSNARMTSTNLHAGAINKATADIPKTEGELKDMAVKMADYVRNPQEEAQQLRGLMFAQYLGGSVASAMVNMTQPIAVTMPYLSQWGGAVKAAGRMRGALADVLKDSTGDAKLDAALKKAADEGIVAPQEVHQLMAQARGRGTLQAGDGTTAGDLRAKASNALSKVALAWGKPFAAAELFNRRVTFIAAWRTAVAEGLDNPAEFAKEAIRETQFVYNKGNKPQWARGAIGATLFTFKQYSVSYMELLHRMYTQGGPEGKRAVLFALGMLFLMGGSGGLPFVGDAEDIVDGIMQRLGYSFSTKQARRQFFIDTLGEGAANFVERGISGLPGVPIDVAGRLGMGNLIPGTGLLTKKADHGRDVAELLGPAGDLAQRAFQGAGQIVSGNPVEGLGTMSPTAVRNLQKAMDMHQTGMYRDTKGRKVIDVDGFDALVKAIGFQPTAVARVQDAVSTQQDMISQNKLMKTELADDMATAMFEQDAAKQQAVRERARRWNTSNPSSPVTIDMMGVRRRLVAMRSTKAERVEKSAPKAIRADVKRALEEGAS